MANTEQALKLIRDALEDSNELLRSIGGEGVEQALAQVRDNYNAIEALTAASAEAATPVAWMTEDGRVAMDSTKQNMPNAVRIIFSVPLFTAPQASQPIGQPYGYAVEGCDGHVTFFKGRRPIAFDDPKWNGLMKVIPLHSGQPVSGAMTDADIDALVKSVCHSDPVMASGEYCLTIDEVREFLSASGQAGQSDVAEPTDLNGIERYRLQMAAISTAAIGYWKEGDGILPDYDTPALRDVAKLYAKYAALSSTPAQQTEAPVNVPITDTDSAREFIVQWQHQYMKDHPFFTRYIREDLAGDFAFQLAKALAAAPAPVQTEAQQSEKDAERYRWLRDKASSQEVERLWWMDSVEEMEAALDSAIANEKANQKGGAA